MAMDQYFEEAGLPGNFDKDGAFSAKNRESHSNLVSVSEEDGNFDCNICLDSVREPVVTLCGHLFCWPCIHKWLHLHTISTSDEHQRHNHCPVCKSEVSYGTLVPLYGRGRSITEDERRISMPRRPIGPAYRIERPNSPHSSVNLRFPQHGHYSPVLSSGSLSYSMVLDPVIVMFGEMVSTRLFGTRVTDTLAYPDAYNLVGTSGPRMRRQMMQTDTSLSRVCFFLMCCVVLCLLLF
ncbi:PREDICTED: E3 ubiquitin-protein ligase RMA1-like isoform X2 [Tarenaya hassleriana]|nr:PREDICTED: E3 ubiquitin-protein ligase RMA1-like isoform X2 [Tarenaya hassleriana]XP_010556836.1 PREDICTED: E3 ubiquitin-protein ligase RMA1-like isoform X2 [Tarenaya hassleriana]XP_010556837.1 PREDICTED: E3 ubiquitin-protein ligase RMA1-like isoform X2 [Tarenaya hassleriana]